MKMFDTKVQIFNGALGALIIGSILGLIHLSERSLISGNFLLVAILTIMVLGFVAGVTFTSRHERGKKFGMYFSKPLHEIGYSLQQERPLTIREVFDYSDWTPEFPWFINDVPVDRFRYRSRHQRVLSAMDVVGQELIICVEITLNWDYSIDVKIIKRIKGELKLPPSMHIIPAGRV